MKYLCAALVALTPALAATACGTLDDDTGAAEPAGGWTWVCPDGGPAPDAGCLPAPSCSDGGECEGGE